jgi:hypothetical protein
MFKEIVNVIKCLRHYEASYSISLSSARVGETPIAIENEFSACYQSGDTTAIRAPGSDSAISSFASAAQPFC